MILLNDLVKRYGEATAVNGISLQVERGECVFLVGGSGCGKTTTLKMINRLIEPTSGRVEIEGVDNREAPGHELRRRIGYGFQQVGLFPHMTIAENIAVAPELLGWEPARIATRVDELLARMELPPETYRDRRPDELSGGQQQRIGLARALAAEPSILLLDEPFGALDPLTRDRMQQHFRNLVSELELTVVFVSHDMVEALLLADRIVVMEEGQFLQVGTPAELLQNPAHDRVAELLETPRRQRDAVDQLLGAS